MHYYHVNIHVSVMGYDEYKEGKYPIWIKTDKPALYTKPWPVREPSPPLQLVNVTETVTNTKISTHNSHKQRSRWISAFPTECELSASQCHGLMASWWR